MTNELKQTLCEVRKAYRLIYLYQRSVLSTIERFAKECKAPDFMDTVFLSRGDSNGPYGSTKRIPQLS